MLDDLLLVVIVLFPVSETALAFLRRSDSRLARRDDRGSMRLLWLAIALGVGLAVASRSVIAARLPLPGRVVGPLALGLLLAGLAIRWAAIVSLGPLFTVDVAIRRDHVLVDRGMFRYVRHPSYSGLLLAFLGLGVFFTNWLSLVVLMLPIALAVVNRIGTEERALREALGAEYIAYCARTKRLIPGFL